MDFQLELSGQAQDDRARDIQLLLAAVPRSGRTPYKRKWAWLDGGCSNKKLAPDPYLLGDQAAWTKPPLDIDVKVAL